MHSSNDDRVHSFTLGQRPAFERLGYVVYRENTGEALYRQLDQRDPRRSFGWGLSGGNARCVDGACELVGELADASGAPLPPLPITPSFNERAAVLPDSEIEWLLNRPLQSFEGTLAVFLDTTDVTSLWTFIATTLRRLELSLKP